MRKDPQEEADMINSRDLNGKQVQGDRPVSANPTRVLDVAQLRQEKDIPILPAMIFQDAVNATNAGHALNAATENVECAVNAMTENVERAVNATNAGRAVNVDLEENLHKKENAEVQADTTINQIEEPDILKMRTRISAPNIPIQAADRRTDGVSANLHTAKRGVHVSPTNRKNHAEDSPAPENHHTKRLSKQQRRKAKTD
jgi:hypothetical protein